jgi:hypothetical protein
VNLGVFNRRADIDETQTGMRIKQLLKVRW